MRITRAGDVRVRFFERFVKQPNGCWIWIGTKVKMGQYWYGCIAGKIDGIRYTKLGQQIGAHRVSWILHNGPIPEGQVIMHTCDTPLCVNPAHLVLGTQLENIADMNAKNRGNTKGLVIRTGSAHRNAALDDKQVQYVLTSEKNAVELGKELGVSRHLISDIRCGKRYVDQTDAAKLRELAATRKGLSRPGSGNPNSKLTPEQVRYIRASDKTTYAIADELGVTQPTVASARRRATYKNIE